MLTYLRKIRRSLIESGHARKYLVYAIGEIALVVIGILIALQINNRNVENKEAEVEKEYMISLLSDLAKDRRDLTIDVNFGSIPIIYNDSLFTELQKRPLQGRVKRIHHFLLLFTNGIELTYHDRTMSQLRNPGGFGLIANQDMSDAILDYDVYMREAIRFTESSRSNHIINNDILINNKMYEIYKVEHLKDSAIVHKEEMSKVDYPDDLKMLSYYDYEIKLALNSLSSVRKVDNNIYQRAIVALDMNIELDSLIRSKYKELKRGNTEILD